MKRKVLSIVLALAMLFSVFSMMALAQTPPPAPIYLTAEKYLDGEYFNYGPYSPSVKKAGEITELSIENICANGQSVSSQDATFVWYKDGVEISGATTNKYKFEYDGAQYSCSVSYMTGAVSLEFYLREDSLNVTAGSEAELTLTEDEEFIFIGGEVGDTTEIWVNATSTVPNATITYTWVRWEKYLPPDRTIDFEVLDCNTNRCQVVRREGIEGYSCTVDDGNFQETINFEVNPVDTLTDTTYINGISPESYAGTYIAVANPGETLTITVPASSTKGDVKYTWYKTEYDPQNGTVATLIDNVSDTIKVEKTAPDEKNSSRSYGEQTYECYVEDGNERSRYWYMLFCLHPEQIEKQNEMIGEDTPQVTLDDETESLTNNIFREEMQAISGGATGEVKLTAELKNEVSSAEQEIIDKAINENTKIGANLDINLYKTIYDETTQVTETAKEVNISVAVPEDLINTNTEVTRKYQVLRLHNGEAEILDCDFNKDSKKLSFKTDKFSTYTVIYTDAKTVGEDEVPSGEGNSAVETDDKNNSTNEGAEDIKIPQTSDNSNVALWIILLLASAVALSVTTIKIKE